LVKKKAQSLIEYSVILGLVVFVFSLSMNAYARRGIQASLRVSADQLGEQTNGFLIVNRGTGLDNESPIGVSTMASSNTTRDLQDPSTGARYREKFPSQTERDVLTTCQESGMPGKYYDPRDWSLQEYRAELMPANSQANCWQDPGPMPPSDAPSPQGLWEKVVVNGKEVWRYRWVPVYRRL
jgi:hypothetical protein